MVGPRYPFSLYNRRVRRCERTDGCGVRERAHVRVSIVECSKESRRAHSEMLLRRRWRERGANTRYPVAKVFPSGWKENASLYTERSSAGGVRAASDFNREPIYRSDAFLEFFTMLNYAAQTAYGWYNNR